MKITHLTDKGDGPMNEDVLLISPPQFGIFDGATGLIKYQDPQGNTGGFLAANIAKNAFETSPKKTFLSIIHEVNRELTKQMEEANIDFHDIAAAWTSSASVVRINEEVVEYCQVGDSPIVFIYTDGSIQSIYHDHDIETMRLWKKIAKEGVKEIRYDVRMEKQLLKTRRESNIIHGVINGFPEVIRFLKQETIQKKGIETILIFSDGMLIPQDDPEDSKNIGELVRLYKEGGLEHVRDYVRSIENTDPHNVKYPRFKQHDDLTAIAISL